MARDKDEIRAEILEEIDSATAPHKMGWEEARDFLAELDADIRSRIEALTDENEETEDEG
jgi:hypothetical protein